jgi:hypothetical protein
MMVAMGGDSNEASCRHGAPPAAMFKHCFTSMVQGNNWNFQGELESLVYERQQAAVSNNDY